MIINFNLGYIKRLAITSLERVISDTTSDSPANIENARKISSYKAMKNTYLRKLVYKYIVK